MGAQGTATLDFGAFPGSDVVSVDVNTVGVISTSAIEAWIRPVATSDHTDTDHVAANIRIVAQFLSNDNIRIFGVNNNDVVPPYEPISIRVVGTGSRIKNKSDRQNAPMLVGQYNVWWVWN